MMKESIDYFNRKLKEKQLFKTVEFVIVDDGSKDGTLDIIKKLTTQYTGTSGITVKGICQKVNQGKGAAVKYGSLYSKGKYVLFADADAATDINDLDNVMKLMQEKEKNELGCVIGNRNALTE